MNAAVCAMFASDIGMLRILADHKADVNMRVKGLSDSEKRLPKRRYEVFLMLSKKFLLIMIIIYIYDYHYCY